MTNKCSYCNFFHYLRNRPFWLLTRYFRYNTESDWPYKKRITLRGSQSGKQWSLSGVPRPQVDSGPLTLWGWLIQNNHRELMLYYTYITWLRGRHTRILAPRWQESPGALWCLMPKAEGDRMRQGFHVIFWYSRPRRRVIYVMWHFIIIQSQIKWNTLLLDSSLRFKIPLLYLLCLATSSLDLESDLISMQNMFLLCDTTVSGGWHNCIRLLT